MRKALAIILGVVMLCSIQAVAYASQEPTCEAKPPTDTCIIAITVRAQA